MTATTSSVRLFEVGPRDGLQNEKTPIPTALKKKFIDGLVKSGLNHIELTACVSPKAVPQLSDAEDILSWWEKSGPSFVETYVLVPNVKGYERLRAFKRPTVAVVVGVSDEFNQKNIRSSTREALESIEEVYKLATEDKRPFRAYISTSFGCPYQGAVSVSAFMNVFERLLKIGAQSISVGDTIGIAHPKQIREWIAAIRQSVPSLKNTAFHLHDTYGRALANCMTAYEAGIRWFDSSAGGLGGCPYARGASGNVPTEDLVDLFRSMGISVETASGPAPSILSISRAVGELVETIGHVPPGHLFQQWYRKEKGTAE